jgi:hypothetical protein
MVTMFPLARGGGDVEGLCYLHRLAVCGCQASEQVLTGAVPSRWTVEADVELDHLSG